MVYYVYVLLHNAAKQFMYYHFPLSLLRKENYFVFLYADLLHSSISIALYTPIIQYG
jgi:hypothetical protein